MHNPMKVITGPNTRWSYANVWEPKSINGGTPKYSVSLIIPKSDTVTVAKVKAAIEAAYKEGEAKLKGNSKSVPPLSAIKTPLRECERNDRSGHRGRGPESDSFPQRGVLRRVRQSQHHVLRVQLLREPRHRLRPEQPAEDP